MEQVGKFKLYSSEEVLDKHFGKVGTPRRDEFERSVAESVHAYELGEAIKKSTSTAEPHTGTAGRKNWCTKSTNLSTGEGV